MCTGVRFSDDEGNTYFGRNLDWSFSYGETILVTPRGYHYDTVFGAGGKAKPNAVIGVGVVMADRPMYFDCANEHGLAIAGLNFPGYASFVHEPVEGTENVATFEFPLWVARNFDSVDEVEEALRNVTLVSQIVPGQQESLLHWFIGDGKRIDAAISAEDGEVVFRIRDYGPGIPEEELPHVKMKFYKGSSKARGSGIGLAVCEEIVTMHGGTLTLENAEGGGTLVTISIPTGEE